MRKRKKNTDIKKYNRLNLISSIIWILMGLGIVAFGIYYREILEKIFGILAILIGIGTLRPRKKKSAIKNYETKRLTILMAALVIYSLVNPLGNIAIMFDLYKRDYVITGDFDEKA